MKNFTNNVRQNQNPKSDLYIGAQNIDPVHIRKTAALLNTIGKGSDLKISLEVCDQLSFKYKGEKSQTSGNDS